MGMTITEKILTDHAGLGEVVPGDVICVPIGDGGNLSPSGEEKFIACRYATL